MLRVELKRLPEAASLDLGEVYKEASRLKAEVSDLQDEVALAAREAQRRQSKPSDDEDEEAFALAVEADAEATRGGRGQEALVAMAKETEDFATWRAEALPSDWEAIPPVAAFFSRRVCATLHESVREATALVQAIDASVAKSEAELTKLLRAFGDGAVAGSSADKAKAAGKGGVEAGVARQLLVELTNFLAALEKAEKDNKRQEGLAASLRKLRAEQRSKPKTPAKLRDEQAAAAATAAALCTPGANGNAPSPRGGTPIGTPSGGLAAPVFTISDSAESVVPGGVEGGVDHQTLLNALAIGGGGQPDGGAAAAHEVAGWGMSGYIECGAASDVPKLSPGSSLSRQLTESGTESSDADGARTPTVGSGGRASSTCANGLPPTPATSVRSKSAGEMGAAPGTDGPPRERRNSGGALGPAAILQRARGPERARGPANRKKGNWSFFGGNKGERSPPGKPSPPPAAASPAAAPAPEAASGRSSESNSSNRGSSRRPSLENTLENDGPQRASKYDEADDDYF